jgi:hypothetical protein
MIDLNQWPSYRSIEEHIADPSCLDPEGARLIVAKMDAALSEFGRRCVGVMLCGEDFMQRERYATETDPGDISAGYWCPWDPGGDEAPDDGGCCW